MFVLKLYKNGGSQRIIESSSFHIWRHMGDKYFEISTYDPMERYDVGPEGVASPNGGVWDWAYIENSKGATVERLYPGPTVAASSAIDTIRQEITV